MTEHSGEQVGPPLGTKATCERCGKTVWLRKIAVTGHLSTVPTAKVYGWAARKNAKPRPLACMGSWGLARHKPAGQEVEYFGPAGKGWE